MAKINFEETEGDPFFFTPPAAFDSLEVRFWGVCGQPGQPFNIGSGTNFSAEFNVWMEVAYTVQGAQIFYTRTFLHLFDGFTPESAKELVDSMLQNGEGQVGFSGMLPESAVRLVLEKKSYVDGDGEQQEFSIMKLELSADTGVVFGGSSPGRRSVNVTIDLDDYEGGARFMRELIDEMDDALHGKHPNPALLPHGASEWPFVRQINQRAYDALASGYQETYFQEPMVTEAFDCWLDQIPAGGHVLDAGCGHGDPVIARLLEKGFQVTGTDFSPAMLQRARERFPQATFIETTTPEMTIEGVFDGACSLSSLLYLDPIDLLHSINRLHQALKPGGLLFLYAYDLHPSWRGVPLDMQMGQVMWSWTYGADEAARLLEEHGMFEVLSIRDVTTDEEREERRARAKEYMAEEQKKFEEMMARYQTEQAQPVAEEPATEPVTEETVTDPDAPKLDLSTVQMPQLPDPTEHLAYRYVIVARRV